MLRAVELQPLSRQHRDGLIQARRLRQVGTGQRPPADTLAGFLQAWEDELEPHFLVEENLLLPCYGRAAGADAALIYRTIAEHAAIRNQVGRLREMAAGDAAPAAAELGRALDDHIRFEERVLFPGIEAALGAGELEALGRALAAAVPAYCRVQSNTTPR